MDRQTVYPGQILPETTLLQIAKDSMIGLAKLSAAMLGTSTMANGFATAPTSPASLQVVVAPGELYALTTIDATAWSSLAADTTHSITKQGIALDSTTLTCAAPTTTGQSINYLVEVAYQDLDATPVLLPYYNSANPSQPYSGQGNNGLTQNTVRKGAVVVQVKAGASAATGSQVTPSPDSGYVGLYVVTVAYGQTTITSANITRYGAAPLLPSGLLPAIQTGSLIFATDTGSANAYVCAFTPAITARTEGQVLRFKVKTTNTGACTLNDGVSTASLVGGAHAALQGGEMVATGDAWVQWNSSVGGGSYILLFCTGAAEQVAPAVQSQQAVQFGQVSGVVGLARNLKMTVATAAATATMTADEVIVETMLGGLRYCLPSFSKTINLATTGAGGMDTGTAPVSGYVGIYAIYNPSTGVSALLAVNGATLLPEVYGGANMPSGYTASALVSVWPTNASSQLLAGFQYDREIARTVGIQVLAGSTLSLTWNPVALTNAVPQNARLVGGILTLTSSAGTGGMAMNVASDANGTGTQGTNGSVTTTNGIGAAFHRLALSTAQLLYFNGLANGPTTYTNIITVNRYSI